MKEGYMNDPGSRIVHGAALLSLLTSLVISGLTLAVSVGTAHAGVCKHAGNLCSTQGFCTSDSNCGCDANNICASIQ